MSEKPGEITIVTTQPLGPYQGLTVAVAFPKGVVAAPSKRQELAWWITDMLPMVLAGLTLAAVIAFLIYAFRKVGRDPPEGTVVPLFSPSDDLSPAAMRYIVQRGFDNRAFAAALIEAGVKGHVILGEDEGVFLGFGRQKYIEGKSGPQQPLQPAEQAAISALVKPGVRLDFDNEHHATFSAAKSRLSEDFQRRFDGTMFKRNYGWTGAAAAVWVLGAYLTALALTFAEGTIPAPFVFAAPIAGAAAFVLWRMGGGMGTIGACVFRLAGFLLAFAASGLALMTITGALGSGRWEPIVLVMLGLPIALSSLLWISAPTPVGRGVLDRIAGFRQYLSITETERLDRMQAPQDTLQVFERWLPYAVALGVENRWADRFAGQLAAAAAAGQTGFGWYAGSHSPWNDTGGFVNSIGSSLATSVSSASTAPGSSSGSGGGGSSGGGGGGGGGGGW